MKMALFEDVPTILAKIMGIYEIKIGSRYHFRFIVMENLSFSCSHISRAFDLKGSRTNRHIDISDMNEEEIEVTTPSEDQPDIEDTSIPTSSSTSWCSSAKRENTISSLSRKSL